MKSRAHLSWLYRELPELVGQGVIRPEVAERLREHYGEPEMAGGSAKQRAIVLFSILGALLIGGGVILLLAHNWDVLSRPLRAAIAVAPLAVAAMLGAWLLWTRNSGVAWREGVGTAQTLAIGASIALVSQTYNMGGSFDDYMLTWSLLALPVAYLLRATLPALLYLVGIAVWAGSVAHLGLRGLWYFPLLAAVLPFIWLASQPERYHPRALLLTWFLAVTASFGVADALRPAYVPLEIWPLLFGSLFALLYLAGARWWSDASSAWQRPLQTVGALGIVGLCLVLSFYDVWDAGEWSPRRDEVAAMHLLVIALIPLAAVLLWIAAWRHKGWSDIMLGGVTPLALAGWLAAVNGGVLLSTILFNLYLLVLGTGTLVAGLRSRRLASINAGMAVLSAVILCRFFDSEISFIIRGLAIIAIGLSFLVVNMLILRRKPEGEA
ncbi:MAG: DUF2157 domain-containing protein [Gammaproteobacteria bacterium]